MSSGEKLIRTVVFFLVFGAIVIPVHLLAKWLSRFIIG